jgi:peptide/nickel transport system ATP-binding protein
MTNVLPTTQRVTEQVAQDRVLDVDNLHTNFFTPQGTVHAVNGVTFHIEQGELVGLVGETGCGKSVTARSIIGLVRSPGRVVQGSIMFGGRDLRNAGSKELRHIRGTEIAFIPQNPFGALNPVMKIEKLMTNVIKAHRRVSSSDAYDIARTMLANVGIAGPDRVLRGYPHELSGGMAQRVVIAIGLMLDPRLVIADEPTTGLDVTIQRQILDLIAEQLAADPRRSMLFVTHDLGIVAQYCKRVIVMYAGRVVESGLVRDVFAAPSHPYTEALLGAVPRPGKKLVSLTGSVPDLIQFPTGCAFADRCKYSHLVDSSVTPEPREIALDHFMSCHLPEGVQGVDSQR